MKHCFYFTICIVFISLNAQVTSPLESTIQFDYLGSSNYCEDYLIYFSANATEEEIVNIPNNQSIEIQSLKILDLENKIFHRLPLFSQNDSITSGSGLVKVTGDTLYYIERFLNDFNDLYSYEFKLVETDINFTFFNKYTLDFPIPISGYHSYSFDWQNNLIVSVIPSSPINETYVFKFSNFDYSFVESFVQSGIGAGIQFPLHKFSDSLYVRVTDRESDKIYFFDRNQELYDSLLYGINLDPSFSHILHKKVKNTTNSLYFTGVKRGFDITVFNDFEIHSVFKHKIGNDFVETFQLDTLPKDQINPITSQIDLIDDAHIYTGLNYTHCWGPEDNCYNTMRFYNVNGTNGEINWTKEIGGDANYFLREVIATQDTGMLAIFQRYDPLIPEKRSDIYWIKFNKDGTQDLDYLSGFTEVQVGINDFIISNEQVRVYPNPASTNITFQFDTLEKEGILSLYNSLGQLICTKSILPYTNERTIDVGSLSKGIYYWQLGKQSGKFLINN